MTNRKKAFLIAAVVCVVLCISAVIMAIFMSAKLSYAENHYEVTRHQDTRPFYAYLKKWVYGCGEIDCEYCNGKVSYEYQPNSFVFYQNTSNLKTAAIVLAILFGIAGATFLIVFFLPSRTRSEKSFPTYSHINN